LVGEEERIRYTRLPGEFLSLFIGWKKERRRLDDWGKKTRVSARARNWLFEGLAFPVTFAKKDTAFTSAKGECWQRGPMRWKGAMCAEIEREAMRGKEERFPRIEKGGRSRVKGNPT